MSWVLDRLKEGNTWKGFVWLLTAAGISVSPEMASAIATVGMAVVGLFDVIQKERAQKVEIVLPSVDLVARPEPSSPPVFVSDDAVQTVRPSEAGAESRNGSGWNG